MQSTLIRYTSSRHIDSYRKGELSLSSLSTFWDLKKGKIKADDLKTGNVTAEDIKTAKEYADSRQQDFSEGAAIQLKRDIINKFLPEDDELAQRIIHDVRFRVNAYGYVNLLCFYRVEALDGVGDYTIDDDGVFALAKEKRIAGINTIDNVKELSTNDVITLVKRVSETNRLLTPEQYHLVQIPPISMDTFGDVVIVIKDEEEFISRVLQAVNNQSGYIVTGDVSYHDMVDRLDPSTMRKHHVSTICKKNDGYRIFHIKEVLKGRNDAIHYGCLDKYFPYIAQKEWRICWLPEQYNTERKILHCGPLNDILEIVPAKEIRRYLMKKYSGYLPGKIEKLESSRHSKGNITYKKFRDKVENIDGMCTLLCDLEIRNRHNLNNFIYGGKEIDPNRI